jgi:hypothetical protein
MGKAGFARNPVCGLWFVVSGLLIEQQLKNKRSRMGAMAACRPCLWISFPGPTMPNSLNHLKIS